MVDAMTWCIATFPDFILIGIFFFSMKIYATARGTQVAGANIKYTLNNDEEQGRTYN